MKIFCYKGAIGEIARELGVNRNTVAAALNGATHTVRAKEIRSLAIAKYGGVEMVPAKAGEL